MIDIKVVARVAIRMRELELLGVDLSPALREIRPVLEWAGAGGLKDPDPETLKAQSRRLAAALRVVREAPLPPPQFLCPDHPFARVEIQTHVSRAGDPDEEGTVFDRDEDIAFQVVRCGVCLREIPRETPTSRMIREHVREVLGDIRRALSQAAWELQTAAWELEGKQEQVETARLVRQALEALGLDPEGGEEALLAWAMDPARHDEIRWALDPYDGCFGSIRNLRHPARRVAEYVLGAVLGDEGPGGGKPRRIAR